MDVRDTAIHRAKSSAPLNGVFWIVNYNEWSRGIKSETPVELRDVFSSTAPSELSQLLQRVSSLRNDRYHFGEKHWLGVPRDAILNEFRRVHPGFSEDVYEHILYLGIVATR